MCTGIVSPFEHKACITTTAALEVDRRVDFSCAVDAASTTRACENKPPTTVGTVMARQHDAIVEMPGTKPVVIDPGFDASHSGKKSILDHRERGKGSPTPAYVVCESVVFVFALYAVAGVPHKQEMRASI